MVTALERKLLRDLVQLQGQVITIALVVACGIASFIAMRTTWASLNDTRREYEEAYRFGDVFAHLARAPESLRGEIEEVEGVSVADVRIVQGITIPMDDMPEPADGLVLSIPENGEPPVNGVYLRSGRLPDPVRSDEALLIESFATAHGLEPGVTLRVVMDGVEHRVRVVGLAMSPEYILPVTQGAISPDDRRFAVLWMVRHAVAPAFQLEGAFNDVAVRLQPGANRSEVIDRLDVILDRYGSLGAYGRERQLSSYALDGELRQLRVYATVVPAIFLGVAAFLLNVVLGRLVQLQRAQIATLKAVGYSNWEIGVHYMGLVSVIVLIGTAIGLAAGVWLGNGITGLYTKFFRFPILLYRMDAELVFAAVGTSLGAAFVGAISVVRAVASMPPAEAMQPASPGIYRRGPLERLGLGAIAGTSGRMVLREIERRPARTFLSALGISLAVGIVVVGRFQQDAIEELIDLQFHRAWGEDVTVVLRPGTEYRAIREISRMPGVLHAEGIRFTVAEVRSSQRSREVLLAGYEPDSDLRELVQVDGTTVSLPPDGAVLTRKLAELLGVRPGDSILLVPREGNRLEHRVVVAGLFEEPIGLQVYISRDALHRLLGESPNANMALLRIDTNRFEEVRERLLRAPGVSNLTRNSSTVARFREQTGEMMGIMILVMTLFAEIIAIGVVYNNARVAVSSRTRELASLRVLGFTRGEISAVLLGELGVQIALGIPLGLVMGRAMAEGIMSMIDPEMYRFPVVISPATYAFAAGVALVSGLVSAVLVRRRLDHLDLVEVLKARD